MRVALRSSIIEAEYIRFCNKDGEQEVIIFLPTGKWVVVLVKSTDDLQKIKSELLERGIIDLSRYDYFYDGKTYMDKLSDILYEVNLCY